jgi:predicted Zn-dependent protease
MKLLFNSILISLGLLLPSSIILAETEQNSPIPEVIVNTESNENVLQETPFSQEPVELNSEESGKTETVEKLNETETIEESSETETLEETNETETLEETSETKTSEETNETEISELTPEELERRQKLIEADELYLSGDLIGAKKLYQQAKTPFALETLSEIDENSYQPIYDLTELEPGAAVFWRIAEEGTQQGFASKILKPLELLVTNYPQFIPGHLRYAQALKDHQKHDEALKVLENAVNLYPNEPELLKVKIALDQEADQWLEASITARQFALFNPDHPEAGEFSQIAETSWEKYQSKLRSKMRLNTIGNVITGALGYVLTGNLLGPISALDSTILLLRGESALGSSISTYIQKKAPLLDDPEVIEYVQNIGNKLTKVTGRDEFEYEFHIIMDDSLNAFALPGGKIFINAGAIVKTHSEAELAGLLAHELSHSVLSHSFQLITKGNFTASLAQFVPFGLGRTATNLLVLNYSRDMERQADIFGTRMLVASGYAADGVYNVMLALDQEQKKFNPPAWLSSHPKTKERLNYLEDLIVRSEFNRYTYEGVARHLEIQERVRELLKTFEAEQEKK